ncbi:MAG: DUF1636 domain-containing protein [Cyanophyceae cyanobacterium]
MTTTQFDVEGLAMTPPAPTTTLFVCTSCASTWEKGQRVGTSGGTRLLAALQEKYDQLPEEQRRSLTIQPTGCMSACSHACAISFSAPGKHQYLFGDLPYEGDEVDGKCDAVFECAALYESKADGMMGWSDRPDGMKKGVIARMPPVPQNLLQTLRRDDTSA